MRATDELCNANAGLKAPSTTDEPQFADGEPGVGMLQLEGEWGRRVECRKQFQFCTKRGQRDPHQEAVCQGQLEESGGSLEQLQKLVLAD